MYVFSYLSIATTSIGCRYMAIECLYWLNTFANLRILFVNHNPQSVECVRHVNKIATYNWEAFVAEEKEMKGNLMLYPIQFSRDGNISSLSGYESFPDVDGKIIGAPTTLPDVLTT